MDSEHADIDAVLNMAPTDQETEVVPPAEEPEEMPLPSEPIQEVLESDESDVIHCWALDSLESARCGSLNIALRRTAVAFVTRAI